jgi:folliculin
LETTEAIIRESCVRSLSCEVYPEGGEGIIFFGDDSRCHVLSRCFVLKDSSARGFQRTYSILVVSKNKYRILSNWRPFVNGINKIVDKLKEKADKVYDKEATVNQESDPEIEGERRNLRLYETLKVVVRKRSPLNTQRSESRARSLKDLTSDPSIFSFLHSEMSSLLRRISIREARFEASCNTLNSQKDVNNTVTGVGSSLRRLYAMLKREKFKVVCYHVIVGHQVVVRSNCPQISRKILRSMSCLLPESAVRITFDAEKYFDNKSCNFISIFTNVAIPSHVLDASDVLIMDLIEHESDQVKCTIHVKGRLPDKLPRYFTDLERVIRDTNYSDESLEYYLRQRKKDWIEKAKISLLVYTTSTTSCSSDVAKDHLSTSHSYRHQLDHQQQEKAEIESSLIKVKRMTGFDITEADSPLLRFWMKYSVTPDSKQRFYNSWRTNTTSTLPKSVSSSVSNISTAEHPDHDSIVQ